MTLVLQVRHNGIKTDRQTERERQRVTESYEMTVCFDVSVTVSVISWATTHYAHGSNVRSVLSMRVGQRQTSVRLGKLLHVITLCTPIVRTCL